MCKIQNCLCETLPASSICAAGSSQSSSDQKPSEAPVVPFGLDLYYWGQDQPNAGKIMKYDSIVLPTATACLTSGTCVKSTGPLLSISSGFQRRWRRRWRTKSCWQRVEVDSSLFLGASHLSAISAEPRWQAVGCVQGRTGSRYMHTHTQVSLFDLLSSVM